MEASHYWPPYEERTVGVVSYPWQEKRPGAREPSFGYTLFSAHSSTYLIDMQGRLIKEWRSTRSVFTAYLTEAGQLLRDGSDAEARAQFETGGAAGFLELVTWDDECVWWWSADPRFRYLTHHDLEPITDGRVLVLTWRRVPAAECLKLGRLPEYAPDGEVWDNEIVELAAPFDSFGASHKQPASRRRGSVTWRWSQFDHLVQDADPAASSTYGDVATEWRKIDLNYCPKGGKARRRNAMSRDAPPHPTGSARFDPGWKLGKTGERDWLHANSVSYDARRSWVLISYNVTSEIFIISRRTDQVLCRFGNPSVYRAGDPHADRVLYCQHSAQFVPSVAGDADSVARFLLFNNGAIPERPYSSVDEFRVDLAKELGSPRSKTPENSAFAAFFGGGSSSGGGISSAAAAAATGSVPVAQSATPSPRNTSNNTTNQASPQHNGQHSPNQSDGPANLMSRETQQPLCIDKARRRRDESLDDDANAFGDDALGPPQCAKVWSHGPKAGHLGSFYSTHSSGVDRCPNGNTLITLGPQGIVFEVAPDHSEAWRYVSPVQIRAPGEPPAVVVQGREREGKFGLFCARRYPLDFRGFRNRVLVPGPRLEDPRHSDLLVTAAVPLVDDLRTSHDHIPLASAT